jgi:hypothetical protein
MVTLFALLPWLHAACWPCCEGRAGKESPAHVDCLLLLLLQGLVSGCSVHILQCPEPGLGCHSVRLRAAAVVAALGAVEVLLASY